jgi:hypothetical protein
MAELEPRYRIAIPRDEVRHGPFFNPKEFAIHPERGLRVPGKSLKILKCRFDP